MPPARSMYDWPATLNNVSIEVMSTSILGRQRDQDDLQRPVETLVDIFTGQLLAHHISQCGVKTTHSCLSYSELSVLSAVSGCGPGLTEHRCFIDVL